LRLRDDGDDVAGLQQAPGTVTDHVAEHRTTTRLGLRRHRHAHEQRADQVVACLDELDVAKLPRRAEDGHGRADGVRRHPPS